MDLDNSELTMRLGQNEPQAMSKCLLKHTALFLLPPPCSTEVKDRIHVLGMLSTYDQDVLLQLVFAARETLAELESRKRFLH